MSQQHRYTVLFAPQPLHSNNSKIINNKIISSKSWPWGWGVILKNIHPWHLLKLKIMDLQSLDGRSISPGPGLNDILRRDGWRNVLLRVLVGTGDTRTATDTLRTAELNWIYRELNLRSRLEGLFMLSRTNFKF